MGLLLSVCLPVLVAGTATAASSHSKATQRVSCLTKTTILIPNGKTYVLPPAARGFEYGTASCGRLLGFGAQKDSFTVPVSGNTVANYWLYFATGTMHGTYTLTPQGTSLNFLETVWTGTLKVFGGTGVYKGVTGTGTMRCKTLDGIHSACTDTLRLRGA